MPDVLDIAMLDPEDAALLSRAAAKTAILDANLLVLFITALSGIRTHSFKRVRQFTSSDARLLGGILDHFKAVATNAYVLAEISNLAGDIKGANRDAWFQTVCGFATRTQEAHVPTSVLGRLPETARFGVTDSALSSLSEGGDYVLITAEFRLAGYLRSLKRQVLNFNAFQNAALLRDDQ